MQYVMVVHDKMMQLNLSIQFVAVIVVILQCQMALGVIEERGESVKLSTVCVIHLCNTFRLEVKLIWRQCYAVRHEDVLVECGKDLSYLNRGI